jgi:hypothetical protein
VGCIGDPDCTSPLKCDQGTQTCVTCSSRVPCASGATCDTSVPGGSCAGTQANGDTCSGSGECVGGNCLDEATYAWPGGYCAQTCATANNCASGSACWQSYCLQTCSSNYDCRDGYACGTVTLDDGTTGTVCLPDCSYGSDCSNGKCDKYSGLCTPTGAGALTGQACTANSDCESQWCITQAASGFPGGYCASLCSTTTLTCGGDGVCDTDGTTDGFGVCYDGCTSSSDCTRSNYDCYSIDTAGDMACVPTCGTLGSSCNFLSSCCSGLSCSGFFSGTCQL